MPAGGWRAQVVPFPPIQALRTLPPQRTAVRPASVCEPRRSAFCLATGLPAMAEAKSGEAGPAAVRGRLDDC
ncbi:hypothetical protein FRACA_2240003 [Frankia canadensis]|uniref:Uncharacterized protein n=1 Tax=Frankia canadensis TaxID=1836972 RepID=A0A2I2KR59_9ACTN|nr:hypothetical protein FRACA_2240003 [Frankia canadensis]SOU55445.1 hypothetical protein FRACA_2240003 [Frankia canadensis]